MKEKRKTAKMLIMNIKKPSVLILFFVMLLSFSFGVYKIEKASLTDEHYWVLDRTPKFWKNLILERDFNGTRRSDKPGVTLMVLSAPSAIKTLNPEKYIENSISRMDEINLIARMPVLIFAVFSLIVTYILINQLLGKLVALWGVVFIGLSPMLLGMSRLVNPDSLLWIFCIWSIICYFIYLKRQKYKRKWLILSGIFMGLALLTKYVASVLYIYFLGIVFLEFIFQKPDNEREKKKIIYKKTFWAFIIFCLVSISTFALLYPAVWVKWSRLFLGTLGSQAFLPIWKFFVGVLAIIAIDIVVFGNRIFTWILNYIEKHRQILGRLIFLLFLIIISVAFINVYMGNRWFDFESILSSPKSSHETESALSIFISNFYPLVFGTSPLAILLVFWISVRAITGKLDFSQTKSKIALYMVILILIYHASSVFSLVASTIRYQIILFPIMLLLGALGAENLFNYLGFKKAKQFKVVIVAMVFLVVSLWQTKPYYLAYASFLLPNQYHLDHKDMGYGSYEAAHLLNNLPDAENISIWSDKKGVCNYFVGSCSPSLVFKDLKKINFDYYVVSSGRFSRVNRLVQVRVKNSSPNTIRLDKLYEKKDPFWEMNFGGRNTNFVKIIDAETVNIVNN